MSQFRIDQIQYFVWALSRDWPSMPGGFDGDNEHRQLKKMAGGYKDVIQASLETIDHKIEHELKLDARHQQYYWLWVDRAVEAVGMLEADGMDLGSRGKVFANQYYKAHERGSKKNAFISLVKPNIDMYESQLRQSNVVFEAVPNSPAQDAQEIADFNDYSAEVLAENHFEQQKERQQHDFAAYGSGCLLTDYRIDEANPDTSFLEERIREGDVLDFEEYMRFKRLIKAHVIRHIDTFEIIPNRNASGPNSWNIAESPQHPYVHWVRQERVADMKRKYPHREAEITARTSDIYRQTNPRSFVTDYNDEDQVTMKTTWVRFPVEYDFEVPVRLANGEVQTVTENNPRSAVCRIDRLEGVGIVDMEIDRFAHNRLPIVQAVNYPSNKHSRGIGLCKYGYAPQKVHQIMFNGQLRMFERMVKGGGWFFKGVIDREEIRQQQKEGTWIGIDRDSLPPDLQKRPVGELVSENQPMQFPTIYERLQGMTEQYTNTAMSAPPARKGFRSGTSGRQDMALMSQSDEISSGGIRSYEAVMKPLGTIVHSNIIQFDGERQDIEFMRRDPTAEDGYRQVVLNEVVNEGMEFDPMAEGGDPWDRWTVFPTKVRNNLKSLKYTTKISTRSLLPTNPTERRLFMGDFIQKAFPLTETKRGIELLKWLVQDGMGGLPGFDTRIERIQASIDEDRRFQQSIAEREDQREMMKLKLEHGEKMEELAQNLKRLEDSEAEGVREDILELLDLMIQATSAERPVAASRLLRQAQNSNLIQR